MRSDAGTECQVHQPILTNDNTNNRLVEMGADGMMDFKDESETGWQPAGVMV